MYFLFMFYFVGVLPCDLAWDLWPTSNVTNLVDTFNQATSDPSLQADAGEDFATITSQLVQLDGSQTQVPSAPDELAFQWTQVLNGAPVVTIQGDDTATPTFTPTQEGDYEILMEVSWRCRMASDTVTVRVAPTTLYPNDNSPIGSNLSPYNYYEGNYPFVNLMKMATPFFSGTTGVWDDGRTLDLDENGWVQSLLPDQIARSFVIVGNEFPLPIGTYTVLFEGQGTLSISGVSSPVNQSPGRYMFDVLASESILIVISETDPIDYLRNISVLPPGGRCSDAPIMFCDGNEDCVGSAFCEFFESNYQMEIFHPTFLSEYKRYKTLRFMDWLYTNRQYASENGVDEPLPIQEWSEYGSFESASWQTIPPEIMVALANKLHADPWICIPHQASDDLVTQFAIYMRDNLDPDLKIYVEYSNEVWNDIFDQHQYVGAMGCQRFSADPNAECLPSGATELCEQGGGWGTELENCMNYGHQFFASRTAEIMVIWENVFGPGYSERLVRVLGSQIGAMSWRSEIMLDHLWDGTEPTYVHIDAVAVAPYFGGGTAFLSVEDGFEVNTAEINGTPVGTYRLLSGEEGSGGPISALTADETHLNSRPEWSHIELIAYEGGQHLHSWITAEQDTNLAINRDPRMALVYAQYLNFWRQITGGTMFVHFTGVGRYSTFGSFGSKEYQGQPASEAPKYQALMDYITASQASKRESINATDTSITVD